MTKTISFVIPVYNEQKRILRTVTALRNAVIPKYLDVEKIIFVNDGSTDDTLKVLQSVQRNIEQDTQAKVEIVSYQENRGKGHAVRTGMGYSDSDYTLFFDADMATPLSELQKFVPYIEAGRPVIVGTRKNGGSTVIEHQPRHREILGRAYTLLSQIILNTWVTDFTCGFKAFSREARIDIFSRSKIDRWGYDSELMFLARKLGYNIVERAVAWSDDRDTKVRLSHAVFTSLAELFKIRFYEITGRYQFGYAWKLAARLGLAGN